jgi:hypothetical protein
MRENTGETVRDSSLCTVVPNIITNDRMTTLAARRRQLTAVQNERLYASGDAQRLAEIVTGDD